MEKWHAITRTEKYKALPEEAKLEAKRRFFERSIIPELDKNPILQNQEARDAAFTKFMSIPDDTGQGYITSMLGAAGRGFGEVVPGAVEGIGALTGIQPLREAGQGIRAGLESIAPVNPIYAESVPVKLAGVGGQISSVLATGGAGGLAGRALAAERIAAAGTQAARQAALTQAVQRGAQTALFGTAAAQGAAEGAQQAEQYGMTGAEAYLRTLAGAATEAGTELLPFGMAAETALAKRALASAPRTTGFIGSTLSEGGEEAIGQIGSNIATKVLAPLGVETPDITEGAFEAGLYGAAGGAMLGGVNALISTPPEKQTEEQQRAAAEFNARPVDSAPPISSEENLKNSQDQASIPVVTPDGVVTWMPAMRQAITPTAPVAPPVQAPSQIEQKLVEYMQNPATKTAVSLVQNAAENSDASKAAKAAQDVIENVGVSVVGQPPAPVEPPSLPTRQAAAPAVGTPPTPTTTPEDAAPKIPLEESLREEPQDRVEVRTPEETGAGDSLLRPAKVKEEVDRSVAMPPPPEGVDEDIIDYVLANWSIESIGKKQRVKRRKTREVEAFEKLSQGLPFPARKILFAPDRKRNRNRGNLDIIAQAAFDKNLISAPDANTLTDAILDAYDARKSGKSPFTEVSQRDQADEQRTLEFEKAIRERTAPLTLIPARDLGVGDVVQIGDDNMRVTFESDEDGYPTAAILTGPKFGEQRVDPNKPLKAEKHDTTNRIQDTSEFVPDEELEGVTPVPITPREEPTDATKGTVTPRGAAILPALEQPPVEAATEVSQPSPNLPALVAVRDNAATPEQVQSLADQGLVEQVDGQNIITEAGVAAMPEDQRPKLTPAERVAEVEGMGVPVERDATKPEQISKFLSDLRFYGTAKMGGDQYTIKQASDDSFYIEKTTEGQRSAVASGFSDIEGAQQGVAELVSPIPEETVATGQPTPAIEEALPERGASVETIASGGGMSIEEARQFLARRSDSREPLIFGRPFSEISGMQQKERPRVLRTVDKLQAIKQIVGDINKFKIPVSQEVVNTYGITLPEGYVKRGDLYVFQPTAAEKPTPDSVAVEPEAPAAQPPAAEAASPVVESAPVEELAEEPPTPEAETQAKKDAEIISRYEKDSLASLNRLISGEKTNATTGNVTLDDANTAMRQIEEARELPNIYFTNATTREEFLADPANESRFPAVWADLKANPNIEGLFDPTTGTAFVFTDKVAVSNLDRKLAEFFGTTPEVAAVRRVLIHESLHKGLGLLSTLDPSAHTAVMRYLNGLFTPEMLDARVADGYTQYSDWRINPDSKAKLIEEVFTEKISTGKELPKDGLWGEFIAVLKQIWRSITGKRGEPTVQDMKDVMRLITNSLRNEGKQRPDRTVGDDSVRFAIPFTRNLLSPEKYARHAELEAKHNAGTITPEETAEAQALVEEAAKAAGFNERLYHGGAATREFYPNTFWSSKMDVAQSYTTGRSAGGGSKNAVVTDAFVKIENPFDFSAALVGSTPAWFTSREVLREAGISKSLLETLDDTYSEDQPVGVPDLFDKNWGSYADEILSELKSLGYDSVSITEDGSQAFVVFSPSQIKSADPFTGVPLEQRFQPTSPDIRYSIPVTHTSESAAISSSAQNAVTEISYTPRDFDVSLAIRRAFDNLTRRAKQTSVTLEMLYNEALKGLGNMTRDEFGRMIQKAYDNNSALLTKGTADFPVFNRDGDRAGSVVLMARGPMASMIPPDAAPAASDNLRNGVDAAFDTENFAKYTGVPIKGRKAQDHISPDAEKIKEAAIQFVSEMIDARVQDGSSSSEAVMEVADTVANGEFGNEYLMGLPERGREPVWNYMLAELESRLRNASLKAAKRGQASTARQLEAKSEYLVDYWYSLGTQQGSNLQSRQAVITNPRYAWMFAEKEAKQRMQKNAEEAVAINAGDPGQLGDQVNRNADEASSEAGVAAGKQFDAVVEENEEADLLREGEAELDDKRRTIWERIKLLIRRRAMFARRKTIKAASAARASLSKAEVDELNAILAMSDEEAAKAEAKDLAELDNLMAEFLGEDKPTDTPVETAKRSKRKRMVKVVEQIIFREGKDVEFRSVSTQDAVADLFNGADEYGKIVEEVGNVLLSRVKQARGAGGAQTPIKQLVESIKRTLLGNLPTPKPAPPTNASLGKMLAMTFAQQIREAGLYADAWSKGRTEVRNLLAETGLKGEALDNELDSIMPPTPALAYAPNAARRTIALAMEQAGVTREQLTDGRINVAENAKAKVMEAFDQAAAAVNLSERGWSKQGKTGRQLAERALNEAVQQWNTQDSNRVKISRIVAEQSESPVSEAEFADKLKSFNLKPAEITKLFDRAKNMAARRVELSEARAQQLIYALGEQFRQGSKDPDKSAGGDSINRAFRDQVSEPMTLDEFIQRLAKLNVGETVATRLFRTAAKERIDRKSMIIFDMLTGPRAASQMLERIARARRGIEMPLRSPISFVQLLSQKARTVNEYRKKVFDQIMASPDFVDSTEEQKERLADLFASVWQDQYAKIFAAKQARLEQSLLAKGKDRGAEALKAVRNEILESINLGVFNNDLLVRLMGEKFGIKTSFTEAEKARITELGEALQDESINKALRNRMGRELVILMAKATNIPIAEILSNWWVSSVLSGPNTVFSIGAAFTNGAYEILGLGPARAIQKLLDGDMRGAVDNLMASVRGLGRYLKAFPEAFNRAWQYLWSGDVALLESAANDPLARIKTLADINRYESVAEILSKDPNAMKRFIGLYTRFWGRLLAALDAFNVMVTKRGALSIALRQSDLSIEQIRDMEEKVGLDIYKSNIVKTDPYFKGRMPRAGTYESALLNSMAEAQMYASLTKLGANIENADFTASQAAMTLNPTGAGGFIYNALMGINAKSTSLANDFVRYAKARQSGDNKRTTLDELELALAYFVQFAAYQAANILGYRFARFAGNKFNQGVSFLPFIGMLRMYEKNQKQLKGSEAAFVDSIYRNQMIGFVMLVVGQLVIKAIADEPDDEKRGWSWNGGWGNLTPEQIKQKLSAGEKQFTIRIGDRVFNYQNWPVNQMFAAIGSISDMIRFSPKEWTDKDYLDRAISTIVAGTSATMEIPALTQAGEIFGRSFASKDPTEQAMSRVERLAAGWLGGFTPRILKDLDMMADPKMRKYKTIWEKTASHIPIYRRFVGEEYYDILGKQIEKEVYPGSREFMERPSDPAYRILGALNSRNIWLTPANAEYRMVGKGRNRRRLTQEEADAYSLETGKAYKSMILRYGPRALQMSTERARAFLSDKADEVRDRALQKVYRGYRSRTSAQ